MQVTQFGAIKLRSGDKHMSGNQYSVKVVPVYVLAVPVAGNPCTEKLLGRTDLIFTCQHQHMLTLFQYRIPIRKYHLTTAVSPIGLPYTRYHQTNMGTFHYLPQRLSENGRIADTEFSNECRLVMFLLTFRTFPEQHPQYHHTNHDPDNTERISHRTCSSHGIAKIRSFRIYLQKRLLGRTKHWSISNRTRQKPSTDRQRNAKQSTEPDCHESSNQKHGKGKQVQLDAAFTK